MPELGLDRSLAVHVEWQGCECELELSRVALRSSLPLASGRLLCSERWLLHWQLQQGSGMATVSHALQGVMLTHSNLAYQRSNMGYFVNAHPGDRTLSLLPPWHIYERAVAYYLFSCACEQVSTKIFVTVKLKRWPGCCQLEAALVQQHLMLLLTQRSKHDI